MVITSQIRLLYRPRKMLHIGRLDKHIPTPPAISSIKLSKNVVTKVEALEQLLVTKGGPMEIDRKLETISKRYKELQHEFHDMTTTIARLTQKGCLDASEHWRDSKYLYLIFPMKDGVRRRDYVGSHPLRIKEARQKIENFNIRQEIIEQQAALERILCKVETGVSSLAEHCEVSQPASHELLAVG